MIDTVYEYAGYTLAAKLQAVLWGAGLPLIVALAGVAYTIHTVTEKGSIKELGLHLFYLVLAAWLLSPAKQQPVATPRFLAILGRATDTIQKRAAAAIQKDFLTAPFEWERIAARASLARVTDVPLGIRMERFLESCAKTALASSGPAEGNLFRPGALPYDPGCERVRAELWAGLGRHVKENEFHRRTLEAAARQDPAGGAAFRERYLDELCTRAIETPGAPLSESALVAASLGDYSYTDPSQSTGSFRGALLGIAIRWIDETLPNAAIAGAAKLQQDWENRFSARQKYYLAVTLGPHAYGLSLLFLLGLFPVAALFALLPGKWRVLVNYGKTFLSVKLWPVCWAALTTFNTRRSVLQAFDPGERGSGAVFMGVAAFYLLTPAVCFLVVQLATRAAAMPFAGAVPPSAGSPVSPVGAVSLAVRQVRP